jgi:hypothetical protein
MAGRGEIRSRSAGTNNIKIGLTGGFGSHWSGASRNERTLASVRRHSANPVERSRNTGDYHSTRCTNPSCAYTACRRAELLAKSEFRSS